MKHGKLGNANFEDAEQEAKEAEGWVKWPRTAEQKAAKLVAEKPEQKEQYVEKEEVPVTRSELLAAASDLGIKVDGRWSNQRLKDEIEKA